VLIKFAEQIYCFKKKIVKILFYITKFVNIFATLSAFLHFFAIVA